MELLVLLTGCEKKSIPPEIEQIQINYYGPFYDNLYIGDAKDLLKSKTPVSFKASMLVEFINPGQVDLELIDISFNIHGDICKSRWRRFS